MFVFSLLKRYGFTIGTNRNPVLFKIKNKNFFTEYRKHISYCADKILVQATANAPGPI